MNNKMNLLNKIKNFNNNYRQHKVYLNKKNKKFNNKQNKKFRS